MKCDTIDEVHGKQVMLIQSTRDNNWITSICVSGANGARTLVYEQDTFK